jgi:hypothetical protein
MCSVVPTPGVPSLSQAGLAFAHAIRSWKLLNGLSARQRLQPTLSTKRGRTIYANAARWWSRSLAR